MMASCLNYKGGKESIKLVIVIQSLRSLREEIARCFYLKSGCLSLNHLKLKLFYQWTVERKLNHKCTTQYMYTYIFVCNFFYMRKVNGGLI